MGQALQTSAIKIQAYGYFFNETGKPLERKDFVISQVLPDHAVVKVAGCGLCHTDISFLSGAVKTKQPLSLILGHEISGIVVEVGSLMTQLKGKNVLIPAVLPCGECELCRSERDNICQNQKMPGNDFHGGFASHIVVPAKYVCEVPQAMNGMKLSTLSVIADAVTTPYQSMKRSHLKKDDVAIVIGTGGIGIYMVQHARNVGAHVIAIEYNAERLDVALKQGAHFGICSKGMEEKELKEKVKNYVKEQKLPKYQWKIFETSGSSGGQSLAFSLLTFASTLGIIGFTMDKLSLRLSNIMAFDADVFGNWGCRPAYYKNVVEDVLAKKINILDNVEEAPLGTINEVLADAFAHKLKKRMIFVP